VEATADLIKFQEEGPDFLRWLFALTVKILDDGPDTLSRLSEEALAGRDPGEDQNSLARIFEMERIHWRNEIRDLGERLGQLMHTKDYEFDSKQVSDFHAHLYLDDEDGDCGGKREDISQKDVGALSRPPRVNLKDLAFTSTSLSTQYFHYLLAFSFLNRMFWF
jgi:hypothetical protein